MSVSRRAGKEVADSGTTLPTVDGINVGFGNMGLNSEQNDGWEVYGKKAKNKGGSKQQAPPQNPVPKPGWGNPDTLQKLGMHNNMGSGRGFHSGNNWTTPNDPRKPAAGRGNYRPQLHDHRAFGNAFTPSSAPVPPALKNGWDWSARAAGASAYPTQGEKEVQETDDSKAANEPESDNESELLDDSDDDELMSDEFDSDTNEVSYEMRKKNPWFKELFECLDKLSVLEMSDSERQWHCPACKNGPGAIDWFTGLQAVLTHAKTKGTRVKIHRELAQLLEEELSQRGTSAVPSGEVFGKWDGPEFKDKEIVWPPMVMIMNTQHDKDDNDKWIGMGNQELLDCFSSYAAVRARHAYGPQGHRGISVLIFEASAMGYYEAERLGESFSQNGTDRNAWNSHPKIFHSGGGGKRQLYGYMAEKKDVELFNKHSHGKMGLKYEMKSYVEAVWKPAKQMSEDNQQLSWFKNKAAKHKMEAKAYQESLTLVNEKHRQTIEENKIVRLKTKMHHEQNKEEMEYQEQFFKEQLKTIYDDRVTKEDNFEKRQQEQREMVKQSNADDHRHRAENVAKFIKLQDTEMEKFVDERETLIKVHDERIAAMRRKHWEEQVALEKQFDTELAGLMDKYSPQQSDPQ